MCIEIGICKYRTKKAGYAGMLNWLEFKCLWLAGL